jgi:hypothetical protein
LDGPINRHPEAPYASCSSGRRNEGKAQSPLVPSLQSTVESEVLIRKPGRGEGLECPSTPNQKDARTTRPRIPCYREEVLDVVVVFSKKRMERNLGYLYFTKGKKIKVPIAHKPHMQLATLTTILLSINR